MPAEGMLMGLYDICMTVPRLSFFQAPIMIAVTDSIAVKLNGMERGVWKMEVVK